MNNEPALIIAGVEAAIALVVAFGVAYISPAQSAAIIGVVSAVLAIVGGFTIRSQVTPVSRSS